MVAALYTMEDFVKKYIADPERWRKQLTTAEWEKVIKSVENVLEMSPKTIRLEFEAKIIFRRFPHTTEEHIAEAPDSELKWPESEFKNQMLFWRWMWMNNKEYVITTYMTDEYGMDIMDEVAEEIEDSKVSKDKDKMEAMIIWRDHRTDKFKEAIRKLFDEQPAHCAPAPKPVILEEENSDEVYSDEESAEPAEEKETIPDDSSTEEPAAEEPTIPEDDSSAAEEEQETIPEDDSSEEPAIIKRLVAKKRTNIVKEQSVESDEEVDVADYESDSESFELVTPVKVEPAKVAPKQKAKVPIMLKGVKKPTKTKPIEIVKKPTPVKKAAKPVKKTKIVKKQIIPDIVESDEETEESDDQ
jgi:hypothetical protein